jgi:hypothetical protein
MLLATSQPRVAINEACALPPAPLKVALTVLAAFWYSAGMLPAAFHGIDALLEVTLKAGTLPGRANVRLAGGAEPT